MSIALISPQKPSHRAGGSLCKLWHGTPPLLPIAPADSVSLQRVDGLGGRRAVEAAAGRVRDETARPRAHPARHQRRCAGPLQPPAGGLRAPMISASRARRPWRCAGRQRRPHLGGSSGCWRAAANGNALGRYRCPRHGGRLIHAHSQGFARPSPMAALWAATAAGRAGEAGSVEGCSVRCRRRCVKVLQSPMGSVRPALSRGACPSTGGNVLGDAFPREPSEGGCVSGAPAHCRGLCAGASRTRAGHLRPVSS